MIETRLLRYVVEIADESSFTRAAANLRVAQPTLSTQVRQLEDRLGCTLFDRADRRPRLTPAGEEFVARARRVLVELSDLEAALEEQRSGRGGRLRIGAVQTVAATLLPDAMGRFRAEFPEVRLVLEELPAPLLADRLREGALDLGIGFTPPHEPGLDHEFLFDEELRLFGLPDALAGLEDPLTPESIATLPLALLDVETCTRRLFNSWATERCLPTREPAFEMTSIEGLLALARSTAVLTVLPHLAATLPGSGGLTTRRLPPPAPRRNVVLLTRPTNATHRGVAAFASALRQSLAEPRSCG